jgi:hypothetical protein
MSRKEAIKFLKELGVPSSKVELCIQNLIEEDVWGENDKALLSGLGRIFKDEREVIANWKAAGKSKEAEERAQAEAEAEAKARIEAEEQEKADAEAKAQADADAATERAQAIAAALARDGISGCRLIVSEDAAPKEQEEALAIG